MYHTGAKIYVLSKNSHIENSNFYKIHLSEISFFIKFTFLKSQFSQNSHFWNLIFHKIHISEISFFTKFTISKSHSSQNSHLFKHQILGFFWIKSWVLSQCVKNFDHSLFFKGIFCDIVKLNKDHYSLYSSNWTLRRAETTMEKCPQQFLSEWLMVMLNGRSRSFLPLMAKSFWFPTTIIIIVLCSVHTHGRAVRVALATNAKLRMASNAHHFLGNHGCAIASLLVNIKL